MEYSKRLLRVASCGLRAAAQQFIELLGFIGLLGLIESIGFVEFVGPPRL